MDKIFEELKGAGKNNVESIVAWMQEAKLVDTNSAAAETAKSWFSGAKNPSDVTNEEFSAAVTKAAEQNHKPMEEVYKLLSDVGPNILSSLVGAASKALAGAFSGLGK